MQDIVWNFDIFKFVQTDTIWFKDFSEHTDHYLNASIASEQLRYPPISSNILHFYFQLNNAFVTSYDRYRPSLVTALSSIGGLIAILKVGALIYLVHSWMFRREVKTKRASDDGLLGVEGSE